jgi:hypothetical protein
MRINDLLWKAGAYAFNANTAVTPPALSRVPFGDYSGLQLWYEQVTAGTGIQTVTITYTNELGTTGKTTTFSIGSAGTVQRLHHIPLAAGDKGIQAVTNVQGTVATVGTFNILIMRRLWSGRVRLVNDGDVEGPNKVGMPIVYEDSALYPIMCPDSTGLGFPEVYMNIVNG